MSEDATRETLKMVATGPITEMLPAQGLPIGLAKFIRLGIDQQDNGKLFLKPAVKGYVRENINGDFPAVIAQYVLGEKAIPGGYKEEPTPNDIGRTHMSLHADGGCYVVIELDEQIAWTFSDCSTPFSTTFFPDGRNPFSEPTLCWVDQAGGFSKAEVLPLRAESINAKTRWAYFVFDRGAVSEAAGDKFYRGFNIHVALYPDDAGSPPILITIDPDVGHPGGQGN